MAATVSGPGIPVHRIFAAFVPVVGVFRGFSFAANHAKYANRNPQRHPARQLCRTGNQNHFSPVGAAYSIRPICDVAPDGAWINFFFLFLQRFHAYGV